MSSLAHLFPNPTLVRVLSLFFLRPEEKFYQRDIAERTGSLLRQVQRALKRIERAGLVTKSREGNRVYYAAVCMHPAFDDLKRAFLKTVALAEVLQKALIPMNRRIGLAFVYGSLARGEETATSAIDLFIVSDLRVRKLAKILGSVGRELDREFNPVVYPPREFRDKARRGHHFIREVLAGPKIWLIGNEDALKRLAT